MLLRDNSAKSYLGPRQVRLAEAHTELYRLPSMPSDSEEFYPAEQSVMFAISSDEHVPPAMNQ